MNITNFLEIRHLTKVFHQKSGIAGNIRPETRAVDDVSFNILKAESFGLVGETGSGKSTLGRCLVRLTEPDQGQVLHQNINVIELNSVEFRKLRSNFQMIFQNPGRSLNPIHTIRYALSEPLQVLGRMPRAMTAGHLEQLLNSVGLEMDILDALPHQLSGGQKQRVVIARILTLNPSFIIADEPTSSVDASMKRQILDLLAKIRKQFGLTLLLISHDLAAIAYATDRAAVMYRGRLIEIAPTRILVGNPGHPYTRQLIQSARMQLNASASTVSWQSDRTDPAYEGCPFVDVCRYVKHLCYIKNPELHQTGDDRSIACHFPEKL